MTPPTKHTHTPGPFSFDGHGINDANGQRLAKMSQCGVLEPYDYSSGLPVRNAEFDRVGNMLAAAPDLYEACQAAFLLLSEYAPIWAVKVEDQLREALAKVRE